jgi:alkylation response protein AidB-like acyl-CoA dehydrogenase
MEAASVIRPLQSPDQLAPVIELLSGILPRSQAGNFPVESFDRLKSAGLMTAPLSRAVGGAGLGLTAGTTEHLLRILATIGRADLSLGRIYEGHVIALQLVHVFGTPDQGLSSARAIAEKERFSASGTPMRRSVQLSFDPSGAADGSLREARSSARAPVTWLDPS